MTTEQIRTVLQDPARERQAAQEARTLSAEVQGEARRTIAALDRRVEEVRPQIDRRNQRDATR